MSEGNPRVLFVDDEPHILYGLRRALRSKRNEWNMVFCEGGREALQEMEEAPYDVIVSDMRMPGMSGLELLRQVRANCPGTARIVLSGYTEQSVVVESVDLVHQALLKPMEADRVREAVSRCLTASECLANQRLSEGLVYLNGMPGSTQARDRFNSLLEKEDPTEKELAEVIATDPFLGSRLLRVANSPFFGPALRRAGLDEAVGNVGLPALRQLVVAGKFEQSEHFPEGVPDGYRRVLSDSAKAGRLAGELVRRLGLDEGYESEARAAGLVSLLGRLGFYAIDAEKAEAAMHRDIPVVSAEEECFGADYARAGAALLELWGMPEELVRAIRHHLNPVECHSPDPILIAVHLAHVFLGHKSPYGPAPSGPKLDQEFLDKMDLVELAEEVATELDVSLR